MNTESKTSTAVRGRLQGVPSYNGLGKLPPQAVDLERAVLGAVMLEKDAIVEVINILKPESFYLDAHSKIYSVCLKMFNNNKRIDILTVTAALRDAGELETIGGAYYITELTDRVASAANIEEHARIVYQKYLGREMIRVATETIGRAYDESEDIFEVIESNETAVTTMLSNLSGNEIADISDLVDEELTYMSAPAEEGLLGVGSGFINLDRVTNGWMKSNLTIVAGRPAMGKTALMLNLARNAAFDFKKPGLLFSLEMSKRQLVQRMIACEASMNLDKIMKRTYDDHEAIVIESTANKLRESKMLFIDETPAISITAVKSKAKRLKMKHDIQWVMIDYLQLMKGSREKNGNREQEIASISSGLKELAKELDIPVIALSQLSRAVESRPGNGKRPQLSDLRESGAIEQDADVVCFLYRPEYYGITEDEEGMPTKGICEVVVAKNRHGSCEIVPLKVNLAIMKFTDLEHPLDATNFPPMNKVYVQPYSPPYKDHDDDDDDMPF